MARTLLFILLTVMPVWTHAQLLDDADALDSRFQEDQRLEAETALGRFSVGVSGISKDERLKATRGDLELGYFYTHEFDAIFPRVAEVRPFVFNRVDSTETAYYESLGLGAGIRFSLHKKYEANNWFLRMSMMTPTEVYRERYGLDEREESILELFAGFEFVLSDVSQGRDIRNRVTPRAMIRLTVPAKMTDPDQVFPEDELRETHARMIGAYLAKAWLLQDASRTIGTLRETEWPVLRIIEQAVDQRLTQAQRIALRSDIAIISDAEIVERRAVVAEYLRRGLMKMMRGNYPLMIVVDAPRPAKDTGQEAAAISVARMSRPGMSDTPSDDPLDINNMIEHYIAVYTASIR